MLLCGLFSCGEFVDEVVGILQVGMAFEIEEGLPDIAGAAGGDHGGDVGVDLPLQVVNRTQRGKLDCKRLRC